ncbi:hypothetical protein LRP88_13055 [Fusarium phalaenopsidis]
MASPYQRIQSAAGDIRILIVQPGQPQDPLKCQLEVARLSLDQGSKPENPPSYEAISYCWGDPTPCEPCELDGIAVKIPASASEVIRRFRLPDAPRRIWIDALCINQQDIAERGEQVSLMGAVYSQCTHCLIWLGLDTDNTAKTAFDTVDKVYTAAREADRESKDPMVEMLSMLSSTSFTRSVFNASFEQRLKGKRGEPVFYLKDTQQDLFKLLRRPWFQRKWVFQEAVLAPESTVYCGTETRPLSAMLEAGHSLYRHRAWSHTQEEFLMIRDLHLLWSYFSPETNNELPVDSRTLVALLAFLRTKFSTDPKDAVFSVLGLLRRNEKTNDSFQALFKADYRRSLSDILASATKYAIIETQTLDVLRFVRPRLNEDADTSQIPSWVPRWHLRHEDIDMGVNRMSPNGEFDSNKKPELIDPLDVTFLKCRGEIIDDICYRFDAPSKDVVKDATALAAFFKNLRSLFRQDILSQVFESTEIDETQARRIRNAILPHQMYSADEESAVISSTLMMGRQYPMQEYRGEETSDFVLLEKYLDEPGLVLPTLPDDEVIPTSTFKDRLPDSSSPISQKMAEVATIQPTQHAFKDGYLVNDGLLKPDMIGPLRSSYPSEPIDVLQARYEKDGYLFMKGILPRSDVLNCREAYFKFLSPSGVLQPGSKPVDGIYNAENKGIDFPSIGAGPCLEGQTGPGSFADLAEKAHTEPWYLEFSSHPDLRDFVAKLRGWGEDTLLLKRSLLRNNTPHNDAIGVHYDQSFLRYGEPTSVTAWIPIGDIRLQGGGLIYLEDSDGLGQQLEDEFNRKAKECGMSEKERNDAFNANMMSTGWLGYGPIQFSKDNGNGKWLLTEYEAGDVVFHKPHMDPENRIRLGTDLRFVDSSKPHDTRWSAPYRFDDGL